MATPPPLPSRLPPKGNPRSASQPRSQSTSSTPSNPTLSSVFSDAFNDSPQSRRPPVAPRTRRPMNSSSQSPPPIPALPPERAQNMSPVEPPSQQTSGYHSQSEERFGTCLQQCYEAINKRHDDELLALESLRNHIFLRMKADKDYSEALSRMNQKASKKVANVDKTSAVVQAWLCFLEMSENLQKQINSGVTQMSGVILHSVDQLIKDKRGAKSVFDQEQQKLENDKKNSCTTVQNLRRDYRKYLQSTESYKKKLEASLIRDPPKPAEQDKYRKKFVLNADKLHSCHNNYSLSILNANTHQEHFVQDQLPFCLDTLQQRMELNIVQWKEAMTSYAKALDLTQTYDEWFRKFYESIQKVDRVQEYVEFIRDNKKEQLAVDYYEFDESVQKSHVAPKVEPGKIIINNLTHNDMKIRLAGLESDLEQYAKDIETKNKELHDLQVAADNENSSSPTCASPTKESVKLPIHVQISNLKAKIKEMMCMQERCQVQSRLIKESVDRMSDSQPPLFDPLGDGVDVTELDTIANANMGGSATKGKTRMMSIGTLKHGLKGLLKKTGGEKKAVLTNVNKATIASPDKDADADSDTSSVGEYDVPPEQPVEEEPWYFGDIDRRLAESKCKNDGDYLVRYSERQNKYVLTCHWNGTGKHFVIQQIPDEKGETVYRFESKTFATIRHLLDFHTSSGTPVTRQSGAKITQYVSKFDKWSLRHEDINVGKKVGKGAFGDVFEANLKSKGTKVAIKSCRSSDVADMEKFLKEAEILKQYNHPNVVQLIGVCAEKDPFYIVMEFMPGGSFLDYLRKKGCSQTKKKICQMCVDACQGMAYLESMHCIHRDLAARNCLVGDDDITKISDFGMSREDEGGIYIVSSGTRQIPIKWTAPEALNYGKYTSSSDIWSFGVLLWEAFTCGSSPYPGMSNQDARSQIEVGYRMPAPADCPEEVYGVMTQCWQYDPEERPDFNLALDMLKQACERIKN